MRNYIRARNMLASQAHELTSHYGREGSTRAPRPLPRNTTRQSSIATKKITNRTQLRISELGKCLLRKHTSSNPTLGEKAVHGPEASATDHDTSDYRASRKYKPFVRNHVKSSKHACFANTRAHIPHWERRQYTGPKASATEYDTSIH